jgi:hypothetical protein
MFLSLLALCCLKPFASGTASRSYISSTSADQVTSKPFLMLMCTGQELS